MHSNRIIRSLIIFIVLITNIGCDQVSKKIVRDHIPLREELTFLGNHIMLTRVENKGAFLSIGESLSSQLRVLVLIIVPCLVLLAGLILLFRTRSLSRTSIIAISFIIGGGLGNIYDRYVYGSVTDFLHVDLYFFRTGIFNMADVSIMIGALTILLTTLLRKSPIPSKNP